MRLGDLIATMEGISDQSLLLVTADVSDYR